jgi:hypothetical protein
LLGKKSETRSQKSKRFDPGLPDFSWRNKSKLGKIHQKTI